MRNAVVVLAVRLLLAAAGGLALWLAFPGYDVWPLAILGCLALAVATAGARWWAGGLAGLLLGLTGYTPMFVWAGTYAGATAWLAMSAVSASFPAALGILLAWLQRGGVIRPVTGAAAWVLMEYARSHLPFGGFPWARLGFSQADAPTLGAVALVGVPGLGFLVALCGGLLGYAVQRAVPTAPAAAAGPGRWRAAGSLAGAVVLVLAPMAVPRPTAGDPIQVAAVQADLPPGFTRTLSAQQGAMLQRYTDRTHELAARISTGDLAQPDLVLWPEAASDLDPLAPGSGEAVSAEIMAAVDAVDAPVLLGGSSRQGGDAPYNMMFSYLPGTGLGAVYEKIYLAPFGERMPLRSILRQVSPWVDRIADFAAGTEPGVVPVPTRAGQLQVGLAICFEVVVDAAIRDLVAGGAGILVVPTSNAWFGESDEAAQHIAASRVRAVEYGRSVVHISNVGVSGLITPDGQVHQRTGLYTEALLSGALPRRSANTPALHTGPWVVPAAAALVALGTLWRPGAGRRAAGG